MIKFDSKFRYFTIKISLLNKKEWKDVWEKDGLFEMIALIFIAMNVNDEWYSFVSNDKDRYIYLFKCENRKRFGQFRKLCEKYIPSEKEFTIVGYDKSGFQSKLNQLQNSSEWIPIKQAKQDQEFTQQELALTKFEKSDEWFPWQKDMYNLIFDQENKIKKADDQKIISIIDGEGKKGKSSFLKWICHSHPKDFLKLGHGSASQLRVAVIKNGPKRGYFIDLARTEINKDKMANLMSVIEEVKNGYVMSTIYKRGGSLIMPNPHIFIFSNKPLNYDVLSNDHWQIYKITDDLKLKSLNVTKIKNGEIVSEKRLEVRSSKRNSFKKRILTSFIIYLLLQFLSFLNK